jgi:hypothetical protein
VYVPIFIGQPLKAADFVCKPDEFVVGTSQARSGVCVHMQAVWRGGCAFVGFFLKVMNTSQNSLYPPKPIEVFRAKPNPKKGWMKACWIWQPMYRRRICALCPISNSWGMSVLAFGTR